MPPPPLLVVVVGAPPPPLPTAACCAAAACGQPAVDALLPLLPLLPCRACCACCARCISSQRPGLNAAASGPHHAGSRCISCGQTSTVVPAGRVWRGGQGCTAPSCVLFATVPMPGHEVQPMCSWRCFAQAEGTPASQAHLLAGSSRQAGCLVMRSGPSGRQAGRACGSGAKPRVRG